MHPVNCSWTAGSAGGAGWWSLCNVLSVLTLAIVVGMSLGVVFNNASGALTPVASKYCLHPGWP